MTNGPGVMNLEEVSGFLTNALDDLQEEQKRSAEIVNKISSAIKCQKAELDSTRIDYFDIVGEDLRKHVDLLSCSSFACEHINHAFEMRMRAFRSNVNQVVRAIETTIEAHKTELNEIDEVK